MLKRDLAGKPGSYFRVTLKKTEFSRGASPQKGSPAKRTGHTLRVATQYIQKTPKNNGLFRIWLAEFGARRACSVAAGPPFTRSGLGTTDCGPDQGAQAGWQQDDVE
jgi:hypothetical protein